MGNLKKIAMRLYENHVSIEIIASSLEVQFDTVVGWIKELGINDVVGDYYFKLCQMTYREQLTIHLASAALLKYELGEPVPFVYINALSQVLFDIIEDPSKIPTGELMMETRQYVRKYTNNFKVPLTQGDIDFGEGMAFGRKMAAFSLCYKK